MTNEEAIKILRKSSLADSEESAEEFCEAYDMAIEALENVDRLNERDTPKKVGHKTLRPTEWGSRWYCSECKADLVPVEFMSFDGGEPANKVSYCWHCGSALDWSEEE